MRLPAVPPRVMWVPDSSGSLATEAVDFCRSIGMGLDDWQEFVLAQSLGLDSDGKWSAFEVGVNTSRQNGKNEIALAREMVGLFLLNEQLAIHSAHEFKTSTEHQRRVEFLIQETPELHKRVKPRGYKHSHGEEGIELRTGQRIRFMTRTKGGGRGHTGDLVVFDEAMILAAAMLGALMPTLSARSVHGSPQLWYFFTAVDQMIHDNGFVAAGIRKRAVEGNDPSLAYFEWSAGIAGREGRPVTPDDLTGEQSLDVGLWRQANPALGVRISEQHVGNEQRSMDQRTFAVERLGIGDWPDPDGVTHSVISLADWMQIADRSSLLLDPAHFAFDVAPDRSMASICAAGSRADGLGHVEVIDYRRGTGWVVQRVVELVGKHGSSGVVCDGSGPAASLISEIEAEGIEVLPVTGKEQAFACGLLFDAVGQMKIRHLGSDELSAAVRGAVKRPLGDAWAWSRKNSTVDISPLVAATLAHWSYATRPVEGFAGALVAFA